MNRRIVLVALFTSYSLSSFCQVETSFQQVLNGTYCKKHNNFLATCLIFSNDSLFEYRIHTDVGGAFGKGTFFVKNDSLILKFEEVSSYTTFKKGTIWKYYIKGNDLSSLKLNRNGRTTTYLKTN
jgi:hypothetical protein